MHSFRLRSRSRALTCVLFVLPVFVAASLAMGGVGSEVSEPCCLIVTLAVAAIMVPSASMKTAVWLQFCGLVALLLALELLMFSMLGSRIQPHWLGRARWCFLLTALAVLGLCIAIVFKEAPAERETGWLDRYVEDVLRQMVSMPLLATTVRFELLCLLHVVLPRRWLQEIPRPGDRVFYGLRQGDCLHAHYIVLVLGSIETAVMHFIVQLWLPMGAWLVTVLSAYVLLVVYANACAVRLRPHVVSSERLALRHGILFSATMEISNVAEVVVLQRRDPIPKGASLKGLGSINVCLRTHEPVAAQGPMGDGTCNSVLLFGVDDPQAFADAVQARMRAVALRGASVDGATA